MKTIFSCLSLLIAAVSLAQADEAEGVNWAVLVAGSTGWSNYRHQAGVCHAYQVLHANGIDDDHIVVMMYDDLADNSRNPTPGIVINQPDGPDVYGGVLKDYTGRDVTPSNFFKVLRGDAQGLAGVGSGKVIKSGPNDRIFVNMVDHGATGLFAFPTEHMYTEELFDIVKEMRDNNMFKEFTMYMESCESGSMFDGMYSEDMFFYSTTSANPYESSYACYYDSLRSTYIGDLYGVCWMEKCDASDLTTLSMGDHYEHTRNCNDNSHSMWYGTSSIQDEMVSAFMGSGGSKPKISHTNPAKDAVPSEDVPLHILLKKFEEATTDAEKDIIENEITFLHNKRRFVEKIVKEIKSKVTGQMKGLTKLADNSSRKVNDWACYRSAVDAFSQKCFNLGQNPYALKMLPTILDLCEKGYKAQNFISAVDSVCTFGKIFGIE